MNEVTIRKYQKGDLQEMIAVWNEVVEDGSYEDICPYYIEV